MGNVSFHVWFPVLLLVDAVTENLTLLSNLQLPVWRQSWMEWSILNAMESWYSQTIPDSSTKTKQKEAGERRQNLDTYDHEQVSTNVAKNYYPLAARRDVIYNIVILLLVLSRFHPKISIPAKIEYLRYGVKIASKMDFDLEVIFLCRLRGEHSTRCSLPPSSNTSFV